MTPSRPSGENDPAVPPIPTMIATSSGRTPCAAAIVMPTGMRITATAGGSAPMPHSSVDNRKNTHGIAAAFPCTARKVASITQPTVPLLRAMANR